MLGSTTTSDPASRASKPTIEVRIIGYFKTPQERAELLAKMYAVDDELAPRLLLRSPDRETQKER